MTNFKEQFILAHEAEIADYLDRNPHASEHEAYDRTADSAYNRMQDRLADLADAKKTRRKEEGQ